MPPRIPSPWDAHTPRLLLPRPIGPRQSKRGIKSIYPPRFNRFNSGKDLPILSSTPEAALKRKEFTIPPRTGALATKVGMTALYDPVTAKRVPCTVLQLDRVQVVAHKTVKKHGYFAVQVGAGSKNPSNVTRPLLGHFTEANVSPKRFVAEFRVKGKEGLLGVGETITAGWFKEGQFVDTRSNSRGMGFAGGMKRWGFSGQPASHGNSLTHRAMGSAGASQGSGSRVLPGKKMAGRMGNKRVTIQNLKVLKVDEPNGLVVVNGAVSGPKGCIVKIQDALKKPWPEITVPPVVETAQPATV
ncbi:mitochondrial 54S ribosomal protein YmL9 [Patellaria atrata CBS 101060]|uniref:Large ribosomal subunit protein uL3m n=1 Tax=Patellaria atrata CBS 101060 TaxID=1346257 RepID=A0A9P4SDI9_9PEZI|nr:mitochondrial 54S ribosomal protein YmL9 [Patellaria atrata CBS 101060]